MSNAASRIITCSMHQDWDSFAIKAGLEQVDGWDERSLHEGTPAQWRDAYQLIADATRDDRGSDKGRRTRVLKRIAGQLPRPIYSTLGV